MKRTKSIFDSHGQEETSTRFSSLLSIYRLCFTSTLLENFSYRNPMKILQHHKKKLIYISEIFQKLMFQSVTLLSFDIKNLVKSEFLYTFCTLKL